jgi:hypothetical protein
MRLVLVLFPMLLLAAPFAACGTSSSAGTGDGGPDGTIGPGDATDELTADSPVVGDAGTVDACVLDDADPVGLCVQRSALQDLHTHAFVATKGAAASWSSTTETPDKDEAGVVTYSLDDTLAYASAAASYLASAEVYGDTTINAALQSDLQKIALQLELTTFAPPPTEYSGELYFHLRGAAAGLRAIAQTPDGDKLDKLADAYGRSIFNGHYFVLATAGDAGAGDAGGGGPHDGGNDAASHDGGDAAASDAASDATGPHDGAADATLHDGGVDATAHDASPGDSGTEAADGIIGNASGGSQIVYAPGDVATAAYALLDLVNRNRGDPSVPAWLAAVRASLNHLQLRAKEPTTGLFYAALLANRNESGIGPDALAPAASSALPNDALLTDTQATFALAMVRAQYLVTANTVVTIGGLEGGGAPTDGGVKGPFLPVLDLPLEAWADAAMKALNGAHALWDGPVGDGGRGAGQGYMDGYILSTQTLITTKSTRPNAFMVAAIRRGYTNGGGIDYYLQIQTLVHLLATPQAFNVPESSSFFTILPAQVAFLRGATRAFLPLEAGVDPTSYTNAAVSAAVEGLNEDFPPQPPAQ